MRYEYSDGYQFEAEIPRDICQAIWDSMHFRFDTTLEGWMRSHANFCQRWNGMEYSTESFEAHVADLLRHGIIKKV